LLAGKSGWAGRYLRNTMARSSISKMLTSGRRKPGTRFFAGIATAFEMPLAEVIVIAEQTRLQEKQDKEEWGP